MITYLIFNTTTGAVNKTITLDEANPALAALNVGAGEDYISTTADFDSSISYITNTLTTKDITTRPSLSAIASWSALTVVANNIATITFGSSLPNPTSIEIVGPPGTNRLVGDVTDGTLTLSVGLIGDYVVTVTVFPYITESYTITGT